MPVRPASPSFGREHEVSKRDAGNDDDDDARRRPLASSLDRLDDDRGNAMTVAVPRHRFVEHTGELELHLDAADLASLLEEAARALAEIMAEDAGGPPTTAPERFELTASDRESLLVDWLNELVYRADVDKCVHGHVHVERANDGHLEATLRGREPSFPRTAVKAATWHRLRVRDTPAGLEATVVLDV